MSDNWLHYSRVSSVSLPKCHQPSSRHDAPMYMHHVLLRGAVVIVAFVSQSIASFCSFFNNAKRGDHGGCWGASRCHLRSTSQPPQWFAAATNLHQCTTSLSSSSLRPSTTGKCVEIITAHASRTALISRNYRLFILPRSTKYGRGHDLLVQPATYI